MKDKIKIVIDASGGDNAPGEIIKGAVEALNECEKLEYIMAGDEEKINAELGSTESELEAVIPTANYSLVKRSGFVASSGYSDTWQRKNDLVMFQSGSCFDRRFEGDVYDVSDNTGTHPVFRAGKPMFMRIS
jgi:CRISPR type III-A-associated RAMP protein Csm4